MPDQKFENPRLVSIYDSFDDQRQDLGHYVSLTKELKAQSVLDVGCGTGCFADRLVNEGLKVVGVDPARASIEAASLIGLAKKPTGVSMFRMWVSSKDGVRSPMFQMIS